MNLKERLVNTKKNNTLLNKNTILFNEGFNINNLFVDKIEVKNIISQFLSSYKNIIYVCDKNIDNMLVANYFYSLSNAFGSTIVDNIEKDIENFNNRISIVPSPNINEIVKIFEYIIYGYRSFVFGLNFSSNLEILNKLKTVIAINFPNLSNDNIQTLIGFSNSLFICIEMQEDGLYYISEINELNYENEKLGFDTLFKLNNIKEEETFTNNKEEIIVEEDNVEETIAVQVIDETQETETFDIDDENKVADEISEEKISESNIILEEENIQQETIQEEDVLLYANIENTNSNTLENKVNKYKLLKEKVKNKKNT